MKFKLYKDVQLKKDIKRYNLKKGDIVTVVEYFDKTKDHPAGYAVEQFNDQGDTIGVYTIKESLLEFISDCSGSSSGIL